MILFSLPETAQEVFDIVAVHMLRQNKRSICRINRKSYIGCAYRGDNGLKCAAGCLIPDEIYNHHFESIPWRLLVDNHDFPHNHARLITKLQYIHDHYDPKNWRNQLLDVAFCYSLNPDVLNTI
jgi:hypothetical protein